MILAKNNLNSCIYYYKMDYEKLITIRNTIENLDESHHPEILRIFQENDISYTENRNGCFVNLTLLNNKTILMLEKYMSFIDKQTKHLDSTEQLKQTYKTRYFEKDNKDNKCNISNVSAS